MQGERRTQSGLSLIELMIVTVVIGVVASISIATLANALDKARQRATMADMQLISRAIEAYEVDNSMIPAPNLGLQVLIEAASPYADETLPLKDHWGNWYAYDSDGRRNYTLASHGKDGLDGDDYVYGAATEFHRDIVMYNGVFIAAPIY